MAQAAVADAKTGKDKLLNDLKQYPDVERLIMGIEGGFITTDGVSTVAATDVASIAFAEPDEKAQSISALISQLNLLGLWYGQMYKDVAAGIYVGEWDDKDSAEIHVDEQRTKIFQRMWNFHHVVTQQAYPTASKIDTIA